MNVLALILYLVIGLGLLWVYRKNYFHPIPFLYLYWVITFPFKYLVYDYFQNFIVGGYISDISVRNEALYWSLLYIIIVLVAYGAVSYAKKNRPSISKNNFSGISAVRVIWFFSGLIFIGFNLQLILSGEITAFLSNRNFTYLGNGFFKVFGSMLFYMSTIVIMIYCHIRYNYTSTKRNLRRANKWVMISVMVGLSFLFLEMVRGKLLIIIIAIILARHLFVKRISISRFIVMGLVGVFALGVMSQAKYWVITGELFVAEKASVESVVERVMGGVLVSFDSSDHLNQTVMVMNEVDVKQNVFQPFIDPVIALIPRVLWQDKPNALGGVELQEYIYPKLVNDDGSIGTYYSVSAVGESLLLGGVLALVLFATYLAVVISCFTRLDFSNPISVMYYIVFFSMLFNVCRAGIFGLNSVLLNMFIFHVIYLMTSQFISYLSSIKSPKNLSVD